MEVNSKLGIINTVSELLNSISDQALRREVEANTILNFPDNINERIAQELFEKQRMHVKSALFMNGSLVINLNDGNRITIESSLWQSISHLRRGIKDLLKVRALTKASDLETNLDVAV